MADDWESKYLLKPGQQPTATPTARGPYPAVTSEDAWRGVGQLTPVPQPTYHGAVLPFTTYSDKSVRFEPLQSGLLASLISPVKSGAALVEAASKGEPYSMGDVLNASTLGVGLNPFVRSGDRPFPGRTGVVADPRHPGLAERTPTSAELQRVGGKQIDAVRDLPVRYNPQALGLHVADQAEQDLIRMGVFPPDSPQLYASLARMRDAPPGAILEPGNLISVRRNLANLFTRPDEHKAGVGAVFDRLNSFIQNPPAGAVLAGPAAEVGGLYARGNANYAAGMRGRDLADIARNADLSRASANSGQNADNALRQRVRRTVVDDQAIRGYTPAEQQALEQIVLGVEGANTRRAAGNVLGGGGGLGANVASGMAAAGAQFLGAGPAVTGTAATTAPLIGAFLKNRAAARTRNALQDVEEATRRRSPLWLENPGGDIAPDISAGREAMARALMLMEARQAAPAEQPPEQSQQSQPLRITVTPRDRYDPENYL